MKARQLIFGTTVVTALTALLAPGTASAQPVHYYGGRVISNVEVVEVAWNGSVDPMFLTNLAGFYQTIVKSSFIDWLTEYDTIGIVSDADHVSTSNQHIGRGTFGGTYTIVPNNMSVNLDDTDIQAELAAQLTAGKLPPPKLDKDGNVNSLYMFDFPAGITITLFGAKSCQSYGAYHFSITYGGLSVPYGVHPHCSSNFNSNTVVHSHELAEAITDTEQGQANQNTAPTVPVAWMTAAATTWDAYETADLCQNANDFIDGYMVQGVWSNFASGCVTHIPICDGVLKQPKCRPCKTFDSGVSCSGPKPACATAGPSQGQCVPCTTASPGACTGSTPICDDATNTCVACLTNADCKEANAPICDQAAKTCRPCQANADCATGVCDTMTDAQQGQCVPCNADADCAMGEKCDAHACVPAAASSTSSSGSGAGSGGGSGNGSSSGSGNGSGGAGGSGAGGQFNLDESGGCGCRTAPLEDSGAAGLVLAGISAIAAGRRRRRARRAA